MSGATVNTSLSPRTSRESVHTRASASATSTTTPPPAWMASATLGAGGPGATAQRTFTSLTLTGRPTRKWRRAAMPLFQYHVLYGSDVVVEGEFEGVGAQA